MQNLPINISPTCSGIWHTPEEIRAAAVGGLRIDYNAGPRSIMALSAERSEATSIAVTDSGAILQAWAGEFSVAC